MARIRKEKDVVLDSVADEGKSNVSDESPREEVGAHRKHDPVHASK